jgi:DNA topoisomerase-2
LEEFITPLLKARNAMTNEVKEFFTKKDFDKWQSSLKPSELRKWRVKYYKGLGTSTPKEAKEYFSNLQKHRLKFQWKSSKEDKLIDNVFSETQSAWRKDWINSFNPKSSNEIDATKVDYLTYEYFINKELILFSIADNIRVR